MESGGLRPPPPGGVFFPGRACQRCNSYFLFNLIMSDLDTDAFSEVPPWKKLPLNGSNRSVFKFSSSVSILQINLDLKVAITNNYI